MTLLISDETTSELLCQLHMENEVCAPVGDRRFPCHSHSACPHAPLPSGQGERDASSPGGSGLGKRWRKSIQGCYEPIPESGSLVWFLDPFHKQTRGRSCGVLVGVLAVADPVLYPQTAKSRRHHTREQISITFLEFPSSTFVFHVHLHQRALLRREVLEDVLFQPADLFAYSLPRHHQPIGFNVSAYVTSSQHGSRWCTSHIVSNHITSYHRVSTTRHAWRRRPLPL